MRHARELEDSVILLRPIAVRDAVASLTVKAFHLAVVEAAVIEWHLPHLACRCPRTGCRESRVRLEGQADGRLRVPKFN